MEFHIYPHSVANKPTGRGYVARATSLGKPDDRHNYGEVAAVAGPYKTWRHAKQKALDLSGSTACA